MYAMMEQHGVKYKVKVRILEEVMFMLGSEG
jgi:hypothetical protein